MDLKDKLIETTRSQTLRGEALDHHIKDLEHRVECFKLRGWLVGLQAKGVALPDDALAYLKVHGYE
ncbi:MAG: hypothetical protein GY727_06055 [Gammaproteobacteria bacterium]|nr:hypothetical protein [Gammaproteobacteria bacterium]MCP4091439.1 hypothetical protein [Gammaproteobacteria bacterium]MCP4929381.1 hypothetical protein [Gammaproteobacteria bacterium]